MNFDGVLPLANAALYEGYALYPYRASSPKNRVRFPFGCVYPRAYARAQSGADRSDLFAECLVRPGASGLGVRVRFLQLVERTREAPLAGAGESSWQEAEERGVEVELPLDRDGRFPFEVPAERRAEPAPSSRTSASVVRSTRALSALLETSVVPVGSGVVKVRVRVSNLSECSALDRDAVLAETLLSTQVLLGAGSGSFVSLLEPPAELAEIARNCEHAGLFPVLVGARGRTDRVLLSPIVFYDYPEIAPESRGDLFDLTEIDEILSLRIRTLSDAEKHEMRGTDPRLAALLDRTESLAAPEVGALHGARRDSPPAEPAPGTRVRLKPNRRADIFDLSLRDRIATVRAVEHDLEGRTYLSVTVDDDPGADLGLSGQPGHRFFFMLDEIELLAQPEEA